MSLIDLDAPLKICFINIGNYPDYASALAEGAVYEVPSEISLYGASGLADLSEIVKTLLDCIGTCDDYSAFIATSQGWKPFKEVANSL